MNCKDMKYVAGIPSRIFVTLLTDYQCCARNQPLETSSSSLKRLTLLITFFVDLMSRGEIRETEKYIHLFDMSLYSFRSIGEAPRREQPCICHRTTSAAVFIANRRRVRPRTRGRMVLQRNTLDIKLTIITNTLTHTITLHCKNINIQPLQTLSYKLY